MGKNNFLLVDLNEKRTKKLAETITSNTSRKILNHLTQKEHDTEANISKEAKLPISTVHYHLQKLQEAGLVIAKEFHYSKKGREVNHYKLANKYIIIAPRKVSGLKQKLRGILPVGIIALGVSAVIKAITLIQSKTFSSLPVAEMAMESQEASVPLMADAAIEAAPRVAEQALQAAQPLSTQPDIALWFFFGSVSVILIYLLFELVKEFFKKK
jgi:DNA-binding transcriptional ArsR family regulator